MKHAASRELYAYWEERRGKRSAPERAEIEPGAIRQVLSDAFILALDAGTGHPFRLAGTRVCALFGRELKGESFIGLWAAASRRPSRICWPSSTDERVGTVAGVTAQSGDGEPIELELLLLPLGARRPSLARTIGILAPLKITAMARFKPARGADARRPPACRGRGRDPAVAALHGAAPAVISSSTKAAALDGFGRRRQLSQTLAVRRLTRH